MRVLYIRLQKLLVVLQVVTPFIVPLPLIIMCFRTRGSDTPGRFPRPQSPGADAGIQSAS